MKKHTAGHHSAQRHTYPKDHVFTIGEWKNHADHTHDKDDPVMGHEEPLARGGVTCDHVVEEWHKWLFSIPSRINPNIVAPSSPYETATGGFQNPVDVVGNKVYMTSFVPLVPKEENIVTHRIYEGTKYILIPIITAEACTEEYPSLTTQAELWNKVEAETGSVTNIVFTIDDVTRMGCYVERKTKMDIFNVAGDNLMGIKPENMKPGNNVEIVYNGYWALLDVDRLGPGDHLITIQATATTYTVGVTLALNLLI